jgi:hypothetical protein
VIKAEINVDCAMTEGFGENLFANFQRKTMKRAVLFVGWIYIGENIIFGLEKWERDIWNRSPA